jgi:hypothetical protein
VLLDGRECDAVAFTRLVQHLEKYLGPLPAGRLANIYGAATQGCNWIAVTVLRDGAVHYIRREGLDAKVPQILSAWWDSTGLLPEYPK